MDFHISVCALCTGHDLNENDSFFVINDVLLTFTIKRVRLDAATNIHTSPQITGSYAQHSIHFW
jgi:hypothetical protein